MPFSLKMPAGLAGWRIVIHDLERLEEAPHVNVIKDGCKWRIRLDDGPGAVWVQNPQARHESAQPELGSAETRME
jgi:hypothetical protein